MPEVFLCPISLIRMGYLHGFQLAEFEFQAVFWVFIFRRIVDYDSTIADDFHDLTAYASILGCNKIADVDLHTSSSWM